MTDRYEKRPHIASKNQYAFYAETAEGLYLSHLDFSFTCRDAPDVLAGPAPLHSEKILRRSETGILFETH